jgi:hypothetical protein
VFAITFCRSPAGALMTSIESRIHEKRTAELAGNRFGIQKEAFHSSRNVMLFWETPNS